jgi:hypothetical protein
MYYAGEVTCQNGQYSDDSAWWQEETAGGQKRAVRSTLKEEYV